jgi:hypothetical protein
MIKSICSVISVIAAFTAFGSVNEPDDAVKLFEVLDWVN